LSQQVTKLGIVSLCFQLLEVFQLLNPVIADFMGD